MIVADAVKLTQSELGDSQSMIRTTLFSLSQTNYHSNHRYNDSEMCYYNPLHRSRRFINQYFRLIDQKAKLFTRNHAHVLRGEKCPDAYRMFALTYRVRRDLNTDVSVFEWLTCLTPTRVTQASRCSKRTARKLPRCGTGALAKSTYCDLSSFGPPLFEIWWPDIYIGGPYVPVKDKMYWPGLARRSEKCAGPAGQCLCRGLWQEWHWNRSTSVRSCNYAASCRITTWLVCN